MKNTYFLTTLLFLVLLTFLTSSYAQKQDTIHFEKKYVNIEENGHGMSALCLLVGDSVIYRGIKKKIIIPEGLDTSELAYFTDYFTGWENSAYLKVPVFLVSGYKDFNCSIYVDLNHNLDFTDDGAPIHLKSREDSVLIKLENKNNSKGIFPVEFRFARYRDDKDRKVCEDFWGNHSNERGATRLPSDYWVESQRHNYLTTKTTLNNEEILIGLYDYNCDGLYNHERDRIMVGDAKSGAIYDQLSQGSYDFKDTCIVKINHYGLKVHSFPND